MNNIASKIETHVEKDEDVIHFFATFGKGLEEIVQNEIKEKFTNSIIQEDDFLSSITGKMFFSVSGLLSNEDIERLLMLKSIERLFICIAAIPTHKELLTYYPHKERRLAFLHNWTQENTFQWEKSFQIFQKLSHYRNEQMDQKSLTDNVPSSTNPLHFRISCKRSGHKISTLTYQDISRTLAHSLLEFTERKWVPNVSQFDLEIYCHITDEHTIIGFPIPKLEDENIESRDDQRYRKKGEENCFSLRSYIKYNGMRSSLAWAMSKLADIKEGQVICDPMCGMATILLEASHNWNSGNTFIGVDQDDRQLSKAVENVNFVKQPHHIEILKGSATKLPFKDSSVDRVICDVPFGHKFGTYSEIKILYPLFLHEVARITTSDTTVVILTSQNQLFEWNIGRPFKEVWNIEKKIPVELGHTSAFIYVLKKWTNSKVKMNQMRERGKN